MQVRGIRVGQAIWAKKKSHCSPAGGTQEPGGVLSLHDIRGKQCQYVINLDTVVLVGIRQHCPGLLLRATYFKQYLMRLGGFQRLKLPLGSARLPRPRVLVGEN